MRLFTRTDPKMTKKLILNDSIFITNRVSVFKNSLTKCSPLLTIVLKLVEGGGCRLGTCTLRMLVLLRDVIFSGLCFLLKSISNYSTLLIIFVMIPKLNSKGQMLIFLCCVQLCASLGTTGTCAFDNLEEVGPICKASSLQSSVNVLYLACTLFGGNQFLNKLARI